jgi:hypothetical protein
MPANEEDVPVGEFGAPDLAEPRSLPEPADMRIGDFISRMTPSQLWSVAMSLATAVATVAGFAYWLGSLPFNRHSPPVATTAAAASRSPVACEPSAKPASPRIEFRTPLANSEIKVGQIFEFGGQIVGLPPGRDAWVVHRRDTSGDGWPRERPVNPTSKGEFSYQDSEHGESGPLWVCLMSVEPAVSRQFTAWLKTQKRTKDWGGLYVNVPGVDELGCVQTHLTKPLSKRPVSR